MDIPAAETPALDTPPPSPPPSPPAPSSASEPKPAKNTPSDPAAAVDKAFVALNRKEKSLKDKVTKFAQERDAFEQAKRDLLTKAAQAEELEAKLKRLRDDADLQREVLGEDFYERLTARQLDPQGTAAADKLRQELAARDKKIEDLTKQVSEFISSQNESKVQAQRAQARAANKSGLEAALEELGDPALYLYDIEELLDNAPKIAEAIKAKSGDWPTYREIVEQMAEEARPRWQRATEAQKRRAERAQQTESKAKGAEKGADKAPPGPRSVSTDNATTPAGKPRKVDPDEEAFEEDAELLKRLWAESDKKAKAKRET